MEASKKNLNSTSSTVNVTDDREARSKFWIAAYTRPRSEKKVSLELRNLGIEIYLPIQKQLRTWSDRKKFVEVPVIPMIIFAKITEEDIQIIREHSLIIRVICQPGRNIPAHIPADQIDDLKYMLGQSEIPVSFEHRKFNTEDIVQITRGHLKGLKGKVKEVKDNMTEIWVSIDLLGGAVIKIKTSEVEHINNNK